MPNIVSRITDSVASNSSPIIYNVAWDATCNVVAGTVSDFLIEIPIPSCSTSEKSYLPRRNITGMAFGISLHSFSIFSNSDKYAVHILTRNSITLIDTFLEVLFYNDINKSILDVFEDGFYVRNYDYTGPYGGQDNKLYLVIDNRTGLVDTGMIHILMTYDVIQDKPVVG